MLHRTHGNYAAGAVFLLRAAGAAGENATMREECSAGEQPPFLAVGLETTASGPAKMAWDYFDPRLNS